MRLFKRCLTAPLRIKTTRGFGVHSPFAFSFITEVMRQSYHYYAYPVEELRRLALKRRKGSRRPAPLKYQHAVFRVVNRFSPAAVLQLGPTRGLDTMAALDTSSDLRVIGYAGAPQSEDYGQTTAQASRRIETHLTLDRAVESWRRCGGDPRFVMVCAVESDSGFAPLLEQTLGDGGVVLFPNIDLTPASRRLWTSLNATLQTHGMTFTNDRFGVIVGLRHLPRQTYMLYL